MHVSKQARVDVVATPSIVEEEESDEPNDEMDLEPNDDEADLPPSYVASQKRLREAKLEAASEESSRVVPDEVVLSTAAAETAESSLAQAFAGSSLTPGPLDVENMSQERRQLHERKRLSQHYAQKLAAHNQQLHQDQGYLAVLAVQTASRAYS